MKIIVQLGLILSFVFMGNAHAANYTGKITKVWAEPSAGDYVMISVDGVPTGNTCSTSGVYHYAFSITGDMGKALLSMALSAYSIQKTVRFIGTGTCTIHSNVESLSNLRLQ